MLIQCLGDHLPGPAWLECAQQEHERLVLLYYSGA